MGKLRDKTMNDVNKNEEMIKNCVANVLEINRIQIPNDIEYFYGLYKNHYICEFVYDDVSKDCTYVCGVILNAKYKGSVDLIRIPTIMKAENTDETREISFRARKNVYFCFDNCIRQKGN